ncbi:ABC transporter permease [Oceanobacillus neutriphilus]|uniref:Peptide ABC transporter permease n=1 Tax=Oceanobacillus neutriphilus TaxID=531815 RepID=A0ABQ2NUL7_9BACI|nr:ABC transporter permease subunit [Oceanobacillus neutriphilus]GGP10921.1 peptide ABC transporter permease [Oceanobacillus neutriphilus]
MIIGANFKRLFKHPLFLSGFLFIFLLLAASFSHAIFFHGVIPVTNSLKDSEGLITSFGPFGPLEVPPLGTDEVGRHIFVILIQGAKYTIGISILVAGLRIIISGMIGFLFENYFSKLNQYVSGLVNGFYFIPAALICYFLLVDVIFTSHGEVDGYTILQKMIFQLFVLTIVAIPTNSLLIGNQIHQIYTLEFIQSAKTLGGGRLHILKKHIIPYIFPQLLIQFTQETIKVLVLLIHLGFFHLLFGGTTEQELDESQNAYISISSEWSGMIGNAFTHLTGWSWMFFSVTIFFTLVILAFNLMTKGMEDVFLVDRYKSGKDRKKRQKKITFVGKREDSSFEFIQDSEKQA